MLVLINKVSLFLAFFFLGSTAYALSEMSVVEVNGKQIPELQGKDISKMSVRVWKAEKWQAIPFQIDEKASDEISSKRRWVLEKAFSRRTDLSHGDEKLDEDELILWMAKDLGEKAPSVLGLASQVFEMNVSGAYAYLFFEPKQEMKNIQSYVNYDPRQDSIDSLGYKNHFANGHAIIQDELIPKNARNGNPLNILDRFKVRVLLALKGLFDVKVEEDNITSLKVAYKAGPIRLIRRVAAYKSLGPIRITPKVQSDFFFYPYYVQIPTQLESPLDGRKYLNENSKGYAGFDFTQFFYGSKFYSDRNPNSVIIDGHMSAQEKNLVTHDVTWWVAMGDKGIVMVKINWDPDLVKAGVTCDLYYVDDRNSLKPPEMDPGEAVVGFQLNAALIPSGHYYIYVTQIFPPLPFQMGEEAILFKQLTLKPSSIH